MFTLRKLKRNTDKVIPYEEQREHVQSSNPKIRAQLAKRTDTRPEILYFLADDKADSVREAVAANHATPLQADEVLSRDKTASVRCILADKIARLLPEMDTDEQIKVRELTRSVLETLAADHLTEVRAIVAEHLKHADNVPPEIVRRLAADVEAVVAAPVLQYSPLLSDEDLLEIIEISRTDGTLTAIARRHNVAESVSDAIAGSNDADAIAVLLANGSAQIREEVLDHLIDQAPDHEQWHEPLVRRPRLSNSAIKRISGFVAASLVAVLAMRHDLDQDTADALAQQVRDSVRGEGPAEDQIEETSKSRAQRLFNDGTLNEDHVDDAVMTGDREFVTQALALLGDLPEATVKKMLNTGSAQMATAAAWKAGISMRLAVKIQGRIAKVPPQQILYARDGKDYPLSDADMLDQIAMLA